MTTTPLMEGTGIHKRFGRTPVLRDVSLSLHAGEFLAVVGRSGEGKTTLLSILAGLLRPDAGTLRLGGRPVEGPGPERAVVFQTYSLLPWLTAYENIALAVGRTCRAWPPLRRRQRAEQVLADVGLWSARDKRPHELSGGMRQRVALARALSTEPEVLLMDEPLSALDALTRATLQDLIERIWEKNRKTVVLVTNDVDEAILLADRIVPMTPGPGATVGPSIDVEIPRPRDRRAINRDPRFASVRARVIDSLQRARAGA